MGGKPEQAITQGLVRVEGRAAALSFAKPHNCAGILVPDHHAAGVEAVSCGAH
jgi:hypothetical protein